MTKMPELDIDPVEELHEIRRKLYRKVGGTPEALVHYLMEQQKRYADRLVNLSAPGPTQGKSRRKSAKPAVATVRKPARRRKAVTA